MIDSHGFTFNIKERRSYTTYWQCTSHPVGNVCKALVTQRGSSFRPGQSAHNHAAEAGALLSAKVVTAVKARALEDKFRPASAIVEEVLFSIVDVMSNNVCSVSNQCTV